MYGTVRVHNFVLVSIVHFPDIVIGAVSVEPLSTMSNVTSISIEHDSRSYYDSHKDITLVTQNFSPTSAVYACHIL